jgi:DNA replication protein DnaC
MDKETRDRIVATLSTRSFDDATFDAIQGRYPRSECPTCDGRGVYMLDFKSHQCDCELQKLLQKHYFNANIGREYHDICLSHFLGVDSEHVLPKAHEYIDQYEENFHYGIGVTATGPVGTGKTFLISSILKELVKNGRSVYFISFEELIDVWGSSWHNEASKKRLQDKLKSVEVLGIDEVRSDARNHSGFLSLGFDSVIRHRTSNLLPTLVTTNMSAEEEQDEFFKVYSLLSARNVRITTTGEDLRKGSIRERIFELKQRGERRPIC